MAQSQRIETMFGDGNYGFQAGTITGSVTTEFHSHAPELPETPPNPLSIPLPFDRDPDYIQRGSLLDEITTKLLRPAARVALVGLGGVGKSQLAIEFAHQLRRKAPETWLLWLYVSDDARFEQSVRSILDQLKVRDRNDPKANVFRLLYGWLCDVSHGPWLVILDNADDARVLLGSPPASEHGSKPAAVVRETEPLLAYIPKCDHGRVLVTSRTKEAARDLVYDGQIIAIEPMQREQAIALLAKKLGRSHPKQDTIQLAQELDYMPLALTQAAAYVRHSDGRCSINQYLEQLIQCDKSEASVLDIDEKDLRRDLESTNSILLTWQISFNRIRETYPSAADLLSLMSFFDRQGIPEALLRKRGEANAADGEDKKFEKDLAVLRNYCLVAVTIDRSVFEMHRLVQLAAKRWLKASLQLERWGSQFISNLDQIFPISDIENWKICRSLFPHTLAAMDTQVTSHEAVLKRASLLCRSGLYALATGSVTDAERMLDEALGVRRAVLGAADLDTLTSMLHLAKVYSDQGRLTLAEDLQMNVVQKRKELLGQHHPDTLVSMSSLADTYLHQGRYNMAETVEVEVLEQKRRVLGERDAATILSMNNLAGTYSHLGRWEEAEKLHLEVIEKDKNVFGENHPNKLIGMSSLAVTWVRQGRLQEAENLQRTVLEKRKEVLGEDHPATLKSMSDLAWTYLKQGRWNEVECLQGRLIEKKKRVLGEGDESTLTSMATLAYMLRALGRRKSALNLMNSCASNSPSDSINHDAYWKFKEQWESEDSSTAATDKACSTSDGLVAGMEKIKKTVRNAFATRFR